MLRVSTLLVLPSLAWISAAAASGTQDNFAEYMAEIRNVSGLITSEATASSYIANIAQPLDILYRTSNLALWDFETNMTDYNQKMLGEVEQAEQRVKRDIGRTSKRFAFETFNNATLRRMFRKLNDIGFGALSDEEAAEVTNLEREMDRIYSSTEVEVDGKKNQALEPELTQIMSQVGDYDHLLEAWLQWHNTAGRQIRPLYMRFVPLANKSAVLNGFDHLKASWVDNYETDNISEVVDALWEEVSPLYKKLHAFVRKKLKDIYPNKLPSDGTIPAHLLGDMWAESWTHLYDHLSSGSTLDVTPAMIKQGWDAVKMFRTAEDFFTSLGMEPMTDTFWNKSMITKPADRKVVCHGSAADFAIPGDFRIKMCTAVTMENLLTAHHEMGHIVYYMAYFHQHRLFQDGANEGFHEAIGDLMALSASTPSHLKMLGLLDSDDIDPKDFQLLSALDKIAFLPFAYLLDKWRWSLFIGETPLDDMNRKFWEYRIRYQGLSPPVKRTETDFDPGAKYHVPANIPYLRYFVSFIIQFQFHEHLCKMSGQLVGDSPLYKCDIYNKTEAGEILRKGLSMGSSKPWQDVFEIMAGTREMSASSIKKYFEPLDKWLDDQIKGETIGWDDAKVDDYMLSSQATTQVPSAARSSVLSSTSLSGTSKPDESKGQQDRLARLSHEDLLAQGISTLSKIAKAVSASVSPRDDKVATFGKLVASHMRQMSPSTFFKCQMAVLNAISEYTDLAS